MANKEVVICSPLRTAIGTYGGIYKEMPATDLGAAVIRATMDQAKLQPGEVGSVVMGNVIQAGNKDESGPTGCHKWWRPRRGPRDDSQPCLRLGCAGHRQRCAGNHARTSIARLPAAWRTWIERPIL